MRTRPSLPTSLAKGVLASVVGTTAMTAFQRLVEMPITGRAESDAPARFAEAVLPISGDPGPLTHRQLNHLAHYGIGAVWGVAFALAGRSGLRGRRAVRAVFPVVYGSDLLVSTGLGVYRPSTWSGRDWAIDVVDKYVVARAISAVYDRLDPPPDTHVTDVG